jgi:hypothetical protein
LALDQMRAAALGVRLDGYELDVAYPPGLL